MNQDVFFKNFELLADAPNGVQKLRELILQLAVMGKLVPQDPNDEPASVFSKITDEENEQFIEGGKTKKSSKISREEIPYELPNSWRWMRLSDISHDWGQKKPDVKFTYIDVTSINKELGVISEDLKVLNPEDAPSRARKIVKKGTVIYSTVRPYLLNIAIVDKDFDPEPIVSTAFAILHPHSGILNKYLYYYLRSKPFISYVEAEMTGMAYPAINDTKLYKGLIPLPPLAEQKLIVTKVDELMALCDKLEARRQKKQEIQSKLNSAALDRMLSAENQEEFEQYWQRICENFDLLYDNPENVEKLRQAILQLAVQGKLAPQDPEDEPASFLIENLIETKDQFPEKSLIPYVVPTNWIWVNASLVSDVIDPQPSHRTPPEVEGGIPYIGMGDINKQLKVNFEKARKVSVKVFEEHKERYQLKKGDFIFGKIGTLGHPVKLPEPFNYTLSANVVLIQPKIELIDHRYIYSYMDSPVMENILSSSSRVTTHAAFGIKRIRILPVPLPPLNEQKRIVEKIEQFMGLCDELESKLRKSREDSEKLMEAVVKGLLEEAATEKTKLNKPIPLQVATIQLK